MSNEIATRGSVALTSMSVTEWPDELHRAVEAVTCCERLENYWNGFPAGLRSWASHALHGMRPEAECVTTEILVAWLDRVLASAKNQRSPEAFAAWFEALVARTEKFPRGAFCKASQNNAMDTIDFAPSVKEIVEAVAPWRDPIKAKVQALLHIINNPLEKNDAV